MKKIFLKKIRASPLNESAASFKNKKGNQNNEKNVLDININFALKLIIGLEKIEKAEVLSQLFKGNFLPSLFIRTMQLRPL